MNGSVANHSNEGEPLYAITNPCYSKTSQIQRCTQKNPIQLRTQSHIVIDSNCIGQKNPNLVAKLRTEMQKNPNLAPKLRTKVQKNPNLAPKLRTEVQKNLILIFFLYGIPRTVRTFSFILYEDPDTMGVT